MDEIKSMFSEIQKSVNELRNEVLSNRQEITNINKSIVPLVTALDNCLKEITDLRTETKEVEKKVLGHSSDISLIKRRELKNNIIIFGVSGSEFGTELLNRVLSIFSQAGITVQNYEVNDCFRLGKGAETKPVLVKFTSFITKSKILEKTRALMELGYKVVQDRTFEDRNEYRAALPYITQLRSLGLSPKFKNGRILVDGNSLALDDVGEYLKVLEEKEKNAKRKREERESAGEKLKKYAFRSRATSAEEAATSLEGA